MIPELPSTLIQLAGFALLLLAGYRPWRRLNQVHDQVTNAHTTNMRDDITNIAHSVDRLAERLDCHIERCECNE